jgi:hypothetical protein
VSGRERDGGSRGARRDAARRVRERADLERAGVSAGSPRAQRTRGRVARRGARLAAARAPERAREPQRPPMGESSLDGFVAQKNHRSIGRADVPS